MTAKATPSNFYYPVFRTIEHEVIELSRVIYFSDEQIEVFSIKISELLSRCSIEVESLLKDLYRQEFNKEPASVGQAATSLDGQWAISKKELQVTHDGFYFSNAFSPFFAPMGYSQGSKDDYYAAYNSIKHDRAKNLRKANINALLRALGALYILNTYNARSVLQSDIFTPRKAGQAIGMFMNLGLDVRNTLDASLLIDYYEYSYFLWQEEHAEEVQGMIEKLTAEERTFMTKKVIRNSTNIHGIMNSLLYRNNKETSVGDMLTRSHELTKDLVSDEPVTVINAGYERVYLSAAEMQYKTDELESPEKVASWNILRKEQTANGWDL